MKDKGKLIESVCIKPFGEKMIANLGNEGEYQFEGNLSIPGSFAYNGNWRIVHDCVSCKSSVEMTFESTIPFPNIQTLSSKYHDVETLQRLSQLITATEIATPGDTSFMYITIRDKGHADSYFDLEIPKIHSYSCKECHTRYLAVFSQGIPQSPNPSIPAGLPGVIHFYEIFELRIDTEFIKLIAEAS